MKELTGEDLFAKIPAADAICIPTNCSLFKDDRNPMSGGCAAQAKTLYPDLDFIYGFLLHLIPHVPVILGHVDKEHPTSLYSIFTPQSEMPATFDHNYCALVSFPTMHSIMEPADLNLVRRSAGLLVELTDTFGWKTVCLAAPGIGIGGLSFEEQVRPVLTDLLDDRFTVMRK